MRSFSLTDVFPADLPAIDDGVFPAVVQAETPIVIPDPLDEERVVEVGSARGWLGVFTDQLQVTALAEVSGEFSEVGHVAASGLEIREGQFRGFHVVDWAIVEQSGPLAVLHPGERQLDPRADPELLVDVVQVHLGGAWSDAEAISDLLVL